MEIKEAQLYKWKDDGTLVPIREIPDWAARNCEAYLALKARGLTLEEIQYVLSLNLGSND